MSQNLQIRQADRKKAKLRIGISGASGSGKTYSALLLAKGIAGDWDKVCVIDTENGSGELYSHLGQYHVITLEAPFTPERYVEAIKIAEKAGMKVIVIDSISHEWKGEGGILEIVDNLGGKYQDWNEVTPRHRKLIERILQSNSHIITTTRRKQGYDFTNDGEGKMKVQKVGLEEVQREGFEYELTINFQLDENHMARASKDRTGLFADEPAFRIDTRTGEKLVGWNESGEVDYGQLKTQIFKSLRSLGVQPKDKADAEDKVMKLTGRELTEENMEAINTDLRSLVSEQQAKGALGDPNSLNLDDSDEDDTPASGVSSPDGQNQDNGPGVEETDVPEDKSPENRNESVSEGPVQNRLQNVRNRIQTGQVTLPESESEIDKTFDRLKDGAGRTAIAASELTNSSNENKNDQN